MLLYCGTSLSHAEARAMVPSHWELRPPIRRGDLPQLLSEQREPGVVLVVDGFFFMSGSVSLMEIRELVEAGWVIAGSSSMGALRAVEAEPLGMIGVGSVYRWIKMFNVEDDDEVAQAVNPENFAAQSMAMVDIRSLLGEFQRRGWIDRKVRKEVVSQVKSHFFPERSAGLVQGYLSKHSYKGPMAWPQEIIQTLPKHQDALRLVETFKERRG